MTLTCNTCIPSLHILIVLVASLLRSWVAYFFPPTTAGRCYVSLTTKEPITVRARIPPGHGIPGSPPARGIPWRPGLWLVGRAVRPWGRRLLKGSAWSRSVEWLWVGSLVSYTHINIIIINLIEKTQRCKDGGTVCRDVEDDLQRELWWLHESNR